MKNNAERVKTASRASSKFHYMIDPAYKKANSHAQYSVDPARKKAASRAQYNLDPTGQKAAWHDKTNITPVKRQPLMPTLGYNIAQIILPKIYFT